MISRQKHSPLLFITIFAVGDRNRDFSLKIATSWAEPDYQCAKNPVSKKVQT